MIITLNYLYKEIRNNFPLDSMHIIVPKEGNFGINFIEISTLDRFKSVRIEERLYRYLVFELKTPRREEKFIYFINRKKELPWIESIKEFLFSEHFVFDFPKPDVKEIPYIEAREASYLRTKSKHSKSKYFIAIPEDDKDFEYLEKIYKEPDLITRLDQTTYFWYFDNEIQLTLIQSKLDYYKSILKLRENLYMKKVEIKKEIRIPGTNIILESKDRIFYKEEIDDDEAEFIKDQIGASGLACVKKLDAAGFTENPEGAKDGFSAKNIQGFSYHVGKDGFTISKDRKQVFKGKHSDVSKGLAAMKKYKD